MAITRQTPNTIRITQPSAVVNDLVASAAITPGHLVERFNSSGVPKFRKHATAGGDTARLVALDQMMLNLDVDTAYAAGDLVEVGVFRPGDVAWMLVASGEGIVAGQKLESKGDGTLRSNAAGTALFTALEAVDNSAGLTAARIKAEAI